MIDYLSTTCSARFFRIEKRPSKTKLTELFKQLSKRDGYRQQGARTIRASGPDVKRKALVSGAVYLVEQEPPFLDGSEVVELRGAFVLLVEYDGYLAVFSRNVGDIAGVLTFDAVPIGQDVSTKVFADDTTSYEAIGTHNMSIASTQIRARTLEAADLRGLVSNIEARRSVLRRLRYRTAKRRLACVPGVSRILEAKGRQPRDCLVAWALDVIDAASTAASRSVPFLESFPQPMSFSALPVGVVPRGLLVDVQPLRELLCSGGYVETRWLTGTPARLPSHCEMALLGAIEGTYAVTDALAATSSTGVSAALKKNKRSYGFSIDGATALRLHVVSDGDRTGLATWLVRNRCVTVTYSDPSYAYIDGEVFFDGHIAAGSELVLNILQDDWPVANSNGEKTLLAAGGAFDPNSLFGMTETQLGPAATALVCDDLGDEWADYIAVSDQGGTRVLRFIHCKSQPTVGKSASAFQEVVGQAIKNLGRLYTGASGWEGKRRLWDERPTVHGVLKYRVGTATVFTDSMNAFAADPAGVREVVLVVDYISKATIAAAFAQIAAGENVNASVVQLLWLLSGFASACIGAGARPVVKCRP